MRRVCQPISIRQDKSKWLVVDYNGMVLSISKNRSEAERDLEVRLAWLTFANGWSRCTRRQRDLLVEEMDRLEIRHEYVLGLSAVSNLAVGIINDAVESYRRPNGSMETLVGEVESLRGFFETNWQEGWSAVRGFVVTGAPEVEFFLPLLFCCDRIPLGELQDTLLGVIRNGDSNALSRLRELWEDLSQCQRNEILDHRR